ncbi:hypothetical protein ACP70R_006277 [Stipagrostis hirtigluma subsp. patula]
MTVDELDANERRAFLAWRRNLARLEENDKLVLTPFEKNIDIWRQLYRVLERSDLEIATLRKRDPAAKAAPCHALLLPAAILEQHLPPCGGHVCNSEKVLAEAVVEQHLPPCGGHVCNSEKVLAEAVVYAEKVVGWAKIHCLSSIVLPNLKGGRLSIPRESLIEAPWPQKFGKFGIC